MMSLQRSPATLKRSLAALFILLWISAAGAAEAPRPANAPPPVESAPVEIDGIELFRLAGIPSFPSEERAHAVRARIIAIARDRTIPASAIVVQTQDSRISITANGRHIVTVVANDAELEGAAQADVARVWVVQIQEAVQSFRAERQPKHLARAALSAVIATVIAAMALFITVRAFRRAFAAAERRILGSKRGVTIRTFEVVRAESVWRAIRTVLSAARVIAILAILYFYLAFVLRQFPWTREAANQLVLFVLDPLRDMGLSVVQYIPKLIFLVLLVLVLRYALTITSVFFHAVADGAVTLPRFDADWALPTYNIIRVLTILLAIVVAYPYLPGSGSPAFQGLSIFAGLILSLGASGAMANVIAGYTVTFRRAFRIGELIRIGDHMGEVTSLRLLVTHLRTPKNEEIIVPNSIVLQSHVINYTRLAQIRGLILHTTVGVGYEAPWRQVEAMLLVAAGRTSGVLRDPPPFVLERSLDDFAVKYELNVYVDTTKDLLHRYAALHRNVLDAFNEHGVQIMTPAYEGDPDQPKIVPVSQWYAPPAGPVPGETPRPPGG